MAKYYTEKKAEANKKWEEANIERISVSVPKGKKAEIRQAAEAASLSVNAWIGQAIEEKLQRSEMQS